LATSLAMIDCMIDHAKEWDKLYEMTKEAFGPDGILALDATYSRLDKELPYATALLKEILRCTGGSIILRRVQEEFEVMEKGKTYLIPTGYKIIMALYYTNCDPISDLHRDATSFIPERYMGSNAEDKDPRFNLALPTFGAGEHYCPGNPIAKMEVMIFMILMSRYKWSRRERVKVWVPKPIVMPEGGLWIRGVPR
jgi:cytochrome P450